MTQDRVLGSGLAAVRFRSVALRTQRLELLLRLGALHCRGLLQEQDALTECEARQRSRPVQDSAR